MSGDSLRQLEEKHNAEKKRRSEQKQQSISFAAFISESALMELERKDMLREAGFISVIGFNDDILTLKDGRKAGRFFEIQIRKKKLRCITDNSSDCAHVGFALALPEVRKALDK